jgi:hypothetical protein
MDQTPILFEFLKGKTYAKRGDRTITIKGAKSGWEKRMCTLQVICYADGIRRALPLVIFKGAVKANRRRIEEKKRYYPRVVVIFNEKAYANTQTTLD